MISIFWTFAGFLTGLLITAVFNPAHRNIPDLPVVGDKSSYYTGTGCVRFVYDEVDCDGKETSLNVLASQK